MSEELIESGEGVPVNVEVRELVDRLIDGRLSEEENRRLESILESDEAAMRYCAERMRFHAEMEELMSPVRVELMQKRHLVVETKKGLATVSKAVSNVVRVENPKFGSALELPPGLKTPKQVLGYMLWGGLALVVLVAVIVFLIQRGPVSSEPQLVFRNASFEDLEINENSPPFIYTVLDWQDYFQTSSVRVCDVRRATDGKKEAQDGQYAVIMEGGFLTQRLSYNDGEAFVARKGLRLKVSGWAMLEEAGKPAQLWISSRVVVSAYPSMSQVEPDVQKLEVESDAWERFEAILTLPSDSLMMKPSIFRRDATQSAVDISGLQLAVSIDNKSKVPMFIDNLKIEVLEDLQETGVEVKK
ncbi:hypothetical protein [Rubritalea tangerina]|uniref:Zinc-finger domain-containing protein n=1 Tax=Rubritalea tangerina TaxID=430798 RepID=A0ABW4Z9M5_9BACT